MNVPRIAVAIDLEWPLRHHQGIVSGVLEVGRERGWTCELDPFLGSPGASSGRYHGVIGRVTPVLAAWARRTRTPAVNVWVNSPDTRLPRVHVDFAAAGRLVARHFLDRGLRRFGFLGRERDAAARALLEGFRVEAGPVDVLLVPGEPRDAAAWARLQRPLARWVAGWRPPLGVLASMDSLARYLCDAALRQGRRIPDEVAVAGSGNTVLLCDLLEPALSSVEYGFERVGRRAAELLAGLMSGRKPPKEPVLLPPSGLVARRSSDLFAVDDPAVAGALRAIWSRSRKPLKVSTVLEEVPASRRTLERRFRTLLGRTIHDEIRRAHLEIAKRLLVETRDPLKAVATQSGFRSPQQFSRIFRAAERVTPLEFRRTHAPR